jgi:hypothetical protein
MRANLRQPSAKNLAEREGFEPPIPVKVCPLSRRIVSTTHAPLRATGARFRNSRIPPLATGPEERLQEFGTSACQHASPDLDPVIQLRMVQHLQDGVNRTRFRVLSAINQALKPGVNHCPSAHRARFNCNKQVASSQTVIA